MLLVLLSSFWDILIVIICCLCNVFLDSMCHLSWLLPGHSTSVRPVSRLRSYSMTSTLKQTVEHSGDVINFQPLTGSSLPRFAGMPTMMRLPYLELSNLLNENAVDVGIIGIPWVSSWMSSLK